MTVAAVNEFRVELGAAETVELITPEEIAHYVVGTPEIARARAVLVEVYRRLTDYITPLRVLSEIAPEIDGLERWIEPTGRTPYLDPRQP